MGDITKWMHYELPAGAPESARPAFDEALRQKTRRDWSKTRKRLALTFAAMGGAAWAGGAFGGSAAGAAGAAGADEAGFIAAYGGDTAASTTAATAAGSGAGTALSAGLNTLAGAAGQSLVARALPAPQPVSAPNNLHALKDANTVFDELYDGTPIKQSNVPVWLIAGAALLLIGVFLLKGR